MGRKYEKIDLEELYELFPDLNKNQVDLYIDKESIKIYDKISKFISNKKNRNKFFRILYTVAQGKYRNDLYEKVETGVAEMKFKGKSFNHTRIFCKEIKNGGKKVVMISIISKKSNTIQESSKLISAVQRVKEYKYDLWNK